MVVLAYLASPEALVVGASALAIAATLIVLWLRTRNRAENRIAGEDNAGDQIVRAARDAIITVDDSGRIETVNPGVERMFGYAAAEATGLSITALVPAPGRRTAEGPHKHTAETASDPRLLGRRKDGTTFPIEMQLSDFAVRGRRLVAAFIRDTTEQRRTEIELRQGRDFVAATVDIAGALIAVLDHEGRIVRFNRSCEETLDYTFAEVRGKYFWDVLSAGAAAEFLRAECRRLLAGEFPAKTETACETRGGQRRLIAWTHTALAGPRRRAEYIVAVGVDVTEQRALEQQFLQTKKLEAVGRLAGGVAHDFNNLLTAITGYSDLVLHSIGERDPIRKDVEEIKKAGERAASLTRQLLALSRKQVIQPKILDLNRVVAGIEEMLRRLIGEDIELQTALEPELGAVMADSGRMEQVILNLVVNARDAMPAGGVLTIETASRAVRDPSEDLPRGEWIVLRVIDHGVGMDAETRSHLFEPFFTTKELGKGTGLGLSVVFNIVRESQGHVGVKSEPGRGSTFSVFLPRVAAAVVPEPPPKPDIAHTTGSETVLLVEDGEEVLALVSRLLVRSGYQVLEARSAAEALACSETHHGPIHLMVTDVVLPKMSGLELAAKFATLRPDTKVIYVSGYDTALQRQTLSAGAVFLQKPFAPEELMRVVREVLDAAPHARAAG